MNSYAIVKDGRPTTEWADHIKTRRKPCQPQSADDNRPQTHCLVCETWVNDDGKCKQFFGWEVRHGNE